MTNKKEASSVDLMHRPYNGGFSGLGYYVSPYVYVHTLQFISELRGTE